MGVLGGPKIDTTGLVLSVDAANVKSFRGEPTVNLLPNLSSWISYIVTPTIVTVTDGPPYTLGKPKQVIQVVASGALHGGGNYGGIVSPNINLLVSQSQSVAVSFWARSLSGNTLQLNFSHQNGGGDNSNLAFSTTNVGSEWRYLQRTASLDLTKNDFYIWNQNIRGGTFQITDFQLENKSYVTPYVSGTRGSGSIQGGGLVDLSYSGNNGILVNGPRFDSGSGGSIVFDGINDYINVTANQSNILTTLTMECWFNASGLPGGDYHVLFQKEGGYSGGSVYGLRVTPGSTFYAMIAYSADILDLKTLFSSTSLVDGRWYHVASTLDSSYNWRIYINGVLENSTTLTSFPFQNSSDINIGTGDNRYTNGKIANLKVYNKALSAQEILQNFNSQRSRFGI